MANRNILKYPKYQIALVIGLILFAVASRLLPHPPNFAPVAAVAIFAGFYLPRGLALSAPLAIMIVSDLIIGLHPLIFWTWGAFLAIALIANYLQLEDSPSRVVGMSLGASVLFFVLTNFGVWLQGALYPPTLEGLISSYYNALPFFRNTLLGDVFYTSALFASYAWISSLLASRSKLLAQE